MSNLKKLLSLGSSGIMLVLALSTSSYASTTVTNTANENKSSTTSSATKLKLFYNDVKHGRYAKMLLAVSQQLTKNDETNAESTLKNIDSLDATTLKLFYDAVKYDDYAKGLLTNKIDKELTYLFAEKLSKIIEFAPTCDSINVFESIDNLTPDELKIFFDEIKNDKIMVQIVFEKFDNDIISLLNEKINVAVIANKKYDGLAVLKDELAKNSDLSIVTKFMVRNDCFREGRTIQVKGIVVHSTASPGKMAATWYTPWNKSYEKGEIYREACVHAFLDDKVVCQYLPWNHRGWHAGGPANNTHIGIEICEPAGLIYNAEHNAIIEIDVEATREYFEEAYNNAVELCVLLCKQYGLTEKDIVCHCEAHELGIASNHQDVMHWWKFYGKNMDDFRADVKKKLT